MTESPISLSPTDEPEVPKIDKIDIPSDESQTEQEDHSKLAKDEDEHPDKPKRKLVRSKPSSNPAAAQAPEAPRGRDQRPNELLKLNLTAI